MIVFYTCGKTGDSTHAKVVGGGSAINAQVYTIGNAVAMMRGKMSLVVKVGAITSE